MAYRCLGVIAITAFLVAYLKMIAVRSGSFAGISTVADRAIYGLLMAAFVTFVTLPQAVLLWTEPDLMQETDLAPQTGMHHAE